MRLPGPRWLVLLAAIVVSSLEMVATASATLSFATAPALPTLPGVTLSGQAQTTTVAMTDFAVSDTTGGAGWNVTVAGESGSGKSPVFKQYCPNASCGADSGPGYIAGGHTLPSDSLTLDTTGAGWTTGGTTPNFQCGSGCFVDHGSATEVVSASTSVAAGTWTTTGFSSTSLSLATSTTLHKLQAGEVYRVNVVWTLNSGP
jgi:hypothetical protein